MRKIILSTAVGLFLFGSAFSQMTPEQMAEMKIVSSSAISPEGKYIAYTLVTPVDPQKENGLSSAHLYVYNTTNHTSTPYFINGNASQIKFRPGKNTISFLSREIEGKMNAIYEISLNGGAAVKLFSYASNISRYSWSPDGQKIAFTSSVPVEKYETSLPYRPKIYEEEFGQVNAYIADLSNGALLQMALDGGSAYDLVWSPNGKKIAVAVAPTSSVDDSYIEKKVKIVSPSSGKILGALDNVGKLGQIEWSPNSETLALLAAYDLNDPTNGTLQFASRNGERPKAIDAGYLGKYEEINWLNDKELYFLSSEGSSKAIGTISVDGTQKNYIFKTDTQNILSFSMNSKGQLSMVMSSPSHNYELFTLNVKDKKTLPQRRTWSNDFLKGLQLGKQEVITYKTRDGKYEIQGMLIYPIDYVKGERVPLITVVHGGPESHYSNGWLTAYSMPGQMAAAKGYAVFYPNYRGSTGYGTDFTYSSQGDPAGAEFNDIVDGIDYLIEQGTVDKDRVGVTGGSYGGYASAWMSTYYSSRFAAAVMFVGISNNISKFGTSDIPKELKLVHDREAIWDSWDKQLKTSPIYHVDKAQTPILIMHGAEDPRVHPAQSMELYRHLKVRHPELPLRLIFYPGEGHGNRHASARYDYNLRMMQWFDTYLKTGNAKAARPSLDLPK